MGSATGRAARIAILSSLALPLPAAAVAFPPLQPDVRLEEPRFDWVDASEETAFYEWSVEVVNDTDRTHRVRVVLELLNDDDQVVNRRADGQPMDFVDLTLEPGQRHTVERQGEIAYELAAEAVSYRHRRELIQQSSGAG